MVKLLDWFEKKAKQGAYDLTHNDVTDFVGRDIVKPAVHQAQGAVAQINPADNGRTYHTVMDQGAQYAPNPVSSVLNQVTHNGATNFGGSLVKPLAQFPLDVGDLAYNKVVAPTFKLPQQNLQNNPILGGVSRYSNANGSVRQAIGSGIQTSLTLAAPGVGRAIDRSFASVAPKIVPRLATQAVARVGTGAILGAPFSTSSYISSNQPITKQGLIQSAKQGAEAGALLGGAGELAAGVAPAALGAARAAKIVAPSRLKTPELNSLAQFNDKARSGALIDDSTYQRARNAAKKANIDYLNPKAIDDLLGAHRSYDTAVQQRAQALQAAKERLAVNNEIGAVGSNVNGSPIGRAFDKHYTPSENASANEQFAADHIRKNSAAAMKAYNDRVTKKFGTHKMVAGDEAKHIIPGFDATKSVDYHEPGSALAKVKYDRLLANTDTKNQMVHIMSGGTGAGKTSALLKLLDPGDYAATIDTNGNKLSSAVSKIEKAMKSGRNVEYSHVHRDPLEAFRDGVIPRTAKEGRLVTPDAHIDTHYGSNEVFNKLREKYADNPRIKFRVIQNKTNEVPTLLEELPKLVYNRGEAYKQLIKEVQDAHAQGKISDAEYSTFLSKARTSTDQGQTRSATGTQPEPTVRPSQEVKAPKASSYAAQQRVSSDPSTGRYASQSQPSSPHSVQLSPTPENAQVLQPGLRTVRDNQTPRQELQQRPSTGVQSPGNRALDSSANSTPTRGFIQSVNRSEEVSPTVGKRAAGTYQVRNTDQLAQKAEKFASGNLGQATERVSSSLQGKKGNISDREVANAIAVAKRLDANKNYSQATDIYENLSKHLTAQGQSIQAASLLDRRTPEGIRYHLTKVFKKNGVEPSKETLDQIEAKMQEIRSTKAGTPERVLATKELQKIVGDALPSNPGDKAIAFWKAGLLTGARTQTGNILSNETFSVLHNLSNPLAAGLDKAISLGTGVRTKALTSRGLASGTAEGVGRAKTFLKTGIDERSELTNKFETHQVNFKSKALNTYVNGVFKLMGAADRPHYYRQLRNSLYDLGTADGKTIGLTGLALRDHATNYVKDPPQAAFQTATNEAEKAVLANDTILSKSVAKLRQAAEDAESPLGKAATEAVINVLMPFTKVPSAFISRVVDYTPAGAIKTIAGQISRKQFDQRALVTAISEATTGTAIMYLGSKLASANLLSGNYPTDPREQQRWKAQGIQPNSLKVGGSWLSMNYLGPVGLLFAAGGRVANAAKQGENFVQQQIQAYAGIPKDLTEQSFLQGLNNGMQAINEPGRYAQNFVKSQAGSIIPTLSNDIATATDALQRQSDGVLDTVKSRIPGLRETLKPAQDVYGNDLSRKTSPGSTLLNPFRPTTAITNSVKAEVARLHDVDPNNFDLQVTPTMVQKSLLVEGTPVKLTNDQRYALQKQVGQTTQALWGQLIKTPEYQALDDVGKAQALSDLRSNASTLATRDFVTANNLASYTKPVSAKVAALADGSANISRYATSTQGGSGSTSTTSPADKYRLALSSYNANQSTMSDVQKYAAKQSLARLKVQAPFPQDVISLYNMSKAKTYDFLTKDKNGKKLGDQLVAYDKALYNAGLSQYMKYKNGLAPSTRSGRSGSRKGRKYSTADITKALNGAGSVKKITTTAPPKATGFTRPTYKRTGLKKYTVRKAAAPKYA